MAGRTYRHSAYWYGYHYGWTYSEAGSYAGKYLDLHSFRPQMRVRTDGKWRNKERFNGKCRSKEWFDGERCGKEWFDGEWRGKDWLAWRNSPPLLDSGFNPFILGAAIAMDIGVAMRHEVKKLADPRERERIKRELMRDLRIVRRPFYYARETERRRRLAAERRKINRRYTTAPMPTPSDIMSAWDARKESREAMIRLGGMLHDLECYVDNCLRFDGHGNVIGRNGGIRGWLNENLPELSAKYKTLMRYKALAMRFRQATGTRDPTPTSAVLDSEPRHEVVSSIVLQDDPVFEHLFIDLEHRLSPNTVFLDSGKIGLTPLALRTPNRGRWSRHRTSRR